MQKGHEGHTPKKAKRPDHIVTHAPPTICDECGSRLLKARVAETRQVFDLPPTPYEVTEYRVLEVRIYRYEMPLTHAPCPDLHRPSREQLLPRLGNQKGKKSNAISQLIPYPYRRGTLNSGTFVQRFESLSLAETSFLLGASLLFGVLAGGCWGYRLCRCASRLRCSSTPRSRRSTLTNVLSHQVGDSQHPVSLYGLAHEALQGRRRGRIVGPDQVVLATTTLVVKDRLLARGRH